MPVNHEYFDNVNTAQWYWYMHNIYKDREERFDTKRNLIEYHASFLEPEIVDKTRRRRKELDANTKQDNSFANTVKGLFGRDVAFDGQTVRNNFKEVHEVSNILDVVDQYKTTGSVPVTTLYNYQDWMNFELE